MGEQRILVCSEFHKLSTGYSTYYHELLKKLHKHFTVAEYACFIKEGDPRLKDTPWKVYPVIPGDNNPLQKYYNHGGTHQFGSLLFDEVCIDFRPTHVIDIRDVFMFDHEYTSPARPYFKWLIMPTVDSYPQNEQWLSVINDADYVFTYQDWSKQLLERSGVNVGCAAPPVASDVYYPYPEDEKRALQGRFGFNGKTVLGTVMRNQRRKLFPDLFKMLSILHKIGRKDTVLYCHTTYPDLGWDIPKYLNEHGVSNSVYFTYTCPCGHIFPSLFNDALTVCPKCRKPTASFPSSSDGIPNEAMNVIYNSFDLYIQYSNSEGFGMPQVEAAACGVPVASIDFSAMSDIVRKLGGIPLEYLTLYDELETGCKRAVPNNELSASTISNLKLHPKMRFESRMNFEKYYGSWDVTTDKWVEAILQTPQNDKVWLSPPKYHTPNKNIPKNLSNVDYARFLILEVLGDSKYVNSYMEARLIRDLNHGYTATGMNGMYFNEMSATFTKPTFKKFTREDAWKEMANLCEIRNTWEKKRESTLRSSLQRK